MGSHGDEEFVVGVVGAFENEVVNNIGYWMLFAIVIDSRIFVVVEERVRILPGAQYRAHRRRGFGNIRFVSRVAKIADDERDG